VRFSRRETRERSGLGNTQVGVHLDRLVKMEYLIIHRAGRGQSFVYELLYDGTADDATPRLPGLIELADLLGDAITTARCTGVEAGSTGSIRPPYGVDPGGGRTAHNDQNLNDDRSLAGSNAIETKTAPLGAEELRGRNGSALVAPSAA